MQLSPIKRIKWETVKNFSIPQCCHQSSRTDEVADKVRNSRCFKGQWADLAQEEQSSLWWWQTISSSGHQCFYYSPDSALPLIITLILSVLVSIPNAFELSVSLLVRSWSSLLATARRLLVSTKRWLKIGLPPLEMEWNEMECDTNTVRKRLEYRNSQSQ